MVPLHMTTARRVVIHAIVVITNPATAVLSMNVQTVQNDAMSEFRKRVQAAYGRAVQNVHQIRFAVVEAAPRVVQISMFMEIPVKLTA